MGNGEWYGGMESGSGEWGAVVGEWRVVVGNGERYGGMESGSGE